MKTSLVAGFVAIAAGAPLAVDKIQEHADQWNTTISEQRTEIADLGKVNGDLQLELDKAQLTIAAKEQEAQEARNGLGAVAQLYDKKECALSYLLRREPDLMLKSSIAPCRKAHKDARAAKGEYKL